jgi:alpha-L-fucosidase
LSVAAAAAGRLEAAHGEACDLDLPLGVGSALVEDLQGAQACGHDGRQVQVAGVGAGPALGHGLWIVAEFLRAFRAAGLQAGLYFSVLDLTAGIGRRSFPPAQRELVLGQITELLTNYGEIPYFIIDGWNAPWGGPSYRELPFEEVDALVKRLQPNCLLMNIGCTEGISGTDVVFFENGAGQELTPGFAGPGALCQKLTRTWFYRDDEKEPKSADWALGLMEQCFASHANFMLNLSPDPDGRIPAPLAARFAEIGARVSFPAPLAELPAGWLQR